MKVQVTLENGQESIVSALLYAFPKKGNAPADYTLTLDGEATKVAQTGGGKHPKYVYIIINGVSHYLPKNIIPVSGSDVKVIKEAPKAAPAKIDVVIPEPIKATESEAEATPAPSKKRSRSK